MNAHAEKKTRFVVVVGVAAAEGSHSFEHVIEAASRIAGSIAGGELHLVHVIEGSFDSAPIVGISNPWSGTDPRARGRDFLQQMGTLAQKTFPKRVFAHLAAGESWREIVQVAERLGADLVVVGTHGRTGVARLTLGSVAEVVVRKSKCPVLVVRRKDYAASDVPEIEPACPQCLQKQTETNGASLWCDRHATHHPKAHLQYEYPQPIEIGSGLLRP
jgi:nucleotide-binding universal stress UspA family protein